MTNNSFFYNILFFITSFWRQRQQQQCSFFYIRHHYYVTCKPIYQKRGVLFGVFWMERGSLDPVKLFRGGLKYLVLS